jgi:KDEL-tailed cysteine endopeptidase
MIVDCESSNYGCGGGFITASLQYAATRGLCSRSSYPYTGAKGSCAAASCAVVARTNGVKSVTPNSQSALEAAVRGVPVVVAVDAGTSAWQFYRSGVVTSGCSNALNHAVLLVGYGSDATTGTQFWRIKNSWGSGWGEAGYVRLARGSAYGASGMCGVLAQPAYPV